VGVFQNPMNGIMIDFALIAHMMRMKMMVNR
jgi:hypothetical protein